MSRTVKPQDADARRGRWAEHRVKRRSEFVDAALRVLETHGPDLPIDAVAAEAGVTKPVLYRYFSDKSALVEALAERGAALLRDRLLPAINAGGSVLSQVRDGVDAYFSVIDEHPNLYWLLARQASPGSLGPVQQNKELIATALTSVIGDYQRVFGLDSGAAEPWAYGLTGLMQSTGEWWLQRRSMSRARVVDYVTRLICAAFTGTLSEAGIILDPAEPLPPIPPSLPMPPGPAASGTAPS